MKDHPDVIPVVEPRNVDDFLDNRVSIWISWIAPKVEFLLTDTVFNSLQTAMQ